MSNPAPEPPGSDSHANEATTDALETIRDLCLALDRERVSYCHWKSNARLSLWEQGQGDLDLLVRRSDVPAFGRVMDGLRFKLARDSKGNELPGVLDYYGLDEPTGRLVHVHAHYQLVLGHDASKNYRLPIEAAFLDSSHASRRIPVPAPEFEYIVFVIRMLLKHSTWDTILTRQGALSTSDKEELAYLSSRSSESGVEAILRQHLPFLDIRLFSACARSLSQNPGLTRRILLGHKLQRSLRSCARRSWVQDLCLKAAHRATDVFRRRVFRKPQSKRLLSGGLMLALVGGDGAGKTTAVTDLQAWLSKHFDNMKVHMGKPSWSLSTVALRALLKCGRSLGLYPFMRADIHYTQDPARLIFPGYPWMLRELCTARDRYLTYRKARRFASNGGISICDRFPLPQVRLMDGAQIERMTGLLGKNWLIRKFIAMENKYYRAMALPDLLIVLKADPEVAARRKTEEDPESVLARSGEIWGLDWNLPGTQVVDANKPRAEVLSAIKTLVWSRL